MVTLHALATHGATPNSTLHADDPPPAVNIEPASARVGRGKHTKRLRELILNDCDVCGEAVTEEEKVAEKSVMKCAQIGCETVWVSTDSMT